MSCHPSFSRSQLLLLLLLSAFGLLLVACAPNPEIAENPSGQVEEGVTVSETRPSEPTVEPTRTITVLPTETTKVISATAVPLPTSTPPAITSVVSFSATGAIRLTTFVPDGNWRSDTPDNIWWSDDSNTLFYQDERSHQAWAYDVQKGITESIAYTPRSMSELASEITSLIPPNADPYAISPRQRHLLFTIPLTEPIPFEPPRYEDESLNPQYTRELWLLKDGVAHRLGMVDSCFLLHSPRWSATENHAVVNTLFTPDVQHACMFQVWWIDLNSLEVGDLPFDVMTDKSILGLDLSMDGEQILISEAGSDGMQYIVDVETGNHMPLPNPLGGSLLIKTDNGMATVGRTVEHGETLDEYATLIWYSPVETIDSKLLATMKGLVDQWSVAPSQKYIAYVVSPQGTYGGDDPNFETGIWLVPMP